MYSFFNILSRIFNKISRIFQLFASKFDKPEIHQNSIIKSTKFYNMHNSLNEKYYIEQYWNFIFPHIKNLEKNITIYDLGCGQGRFSFKLANYFSNSNIYACDFSEHAIDYAINFSAKSESKNRLIFKKESIIDFAKNQKKNSADLIILTEVLFYYPKWKDDIDTILSLLKPGGKIIISFRSQYFNMLNTVSMKNFSQSELILNKREGQVFNGPGIFTWNTSEEIKEFIKSKNLILDEMFGIGVLSGILGDPHHHICEPAKLLDNDKKKLMNAEINLGKSNLDSGRYILTIAHKTHH